MVSLFGAEFVCGAADAKGSPLGKATKLPGLDHANFAPNPSSPLGFTAHTAQIDYPGADQEQVMSGFGWNLEAALGPVTTTSSDVVGLPSAGRFVDPLTGYFCVNMANFTQADGNGYFFVPEYINMDISGATAQEGDFRSPDGVTGWPKSPFPGIPGWSHNNPNTSEFAVSFTAYLYLQAGVTQFGVDSDDGFLLTLANGPNPNDAFDRVNIGEFNGGRGWADTVMGVTAPSNGYYSLRFDYEQGTGAATCELFTLIDGEKVLVNDTNNPLCSLAYPAPELYPAPYAALVWPPPAQLGTGLGAYNPVAHALITVLLKTAFPPV